MSKEYYCKHCGQYISKNEAETDSKGALRHQACKQMISPKRIARGHGKTSTHVRVFRDA